MSDLDEQEISVIQRFRETHHAIATYFALGYTPSKICRITGKSHRSLTIIYNNPMFRELITQKIRKVAEEGEKACEEQAKLDFEVRTLMTRNHLIAEQMLNERLEEAHLTGELPSIRDLNLVTADRGDRLGFSKHTVVTHTQDFASQLDRAISRSNRPKVIEGEVVSVTPSLPDFSNEPSAQHQPSSQPVSVVQAQEQPTPPRRSPSAPGRPSFVDALKRKFS